MPRTSRNPNKRLVQITFCPKQKTLHIEDLVGWGTEVLIKNIYKVAFIEWSYKYKFVKKFSPRKHDVKLESVDGTTIWLGAKLTIIVNAKKSKKIKPRGA